MVFLSPVLRCSLEQLVKDTSEWPYPSTHLTNFFHIRFSAAVCLIQEIQTALPPALEADSDAVFLCCLIVPWAAIGNQAPRICS